MVWGEILVEDCRKKFIDACLKGELSMAELCRLYDISRKNGYKWLNRYKIEGDLCLKDRSRAPLKQALKTESDVEQQILEVRYQYNKWGPKKILAFLKDTYPDLVWPSMTTIGNLLNKKGLAVPRKRRHRVPGKTTALSICEQPNDVWCADFKGWFLTGDGNKCEPFTLTDNSSRFLLRCQKLNKNDTDHVWGILETAFREYGLPLFLRHDNGSPFATCGAGRLSTLSIKLIKSGVIPEWIDPGKPQQNGRHERMHQTLKKETAMPPEATLEKQGIRFKEFIHYFNYIRPHEAITQKTPGSLYRISEREWNGVMKSPEYPPEYIVRKIRFCGSMKFKGNEIFVGNALTGEPVGLKENEEGTFTMYYGPIILGDISRENKFIKPLGNIRKR